MKIAKPAAIFSISTLASIFFIVTKGLKLGLDFTGGISAELTTSSSSISSVSRN
jgi:preprotein translocase subunit SecF